MYVSTFCLPFIMIFLVGKETSNFVCGLIIANPRKDNKPSLKEEWSVGHVTWPILAPKISVERLNLETSNSVYSLTMWTCEVFALRWQTVPQVDVIPSYLWNYRSCTVVKFCTLVGHVKLVALSSSVQFSSVSTMWMLLNAVSRVGRSVAADFLYYLCYGALKYFGLRPCKVLIWPWVSPANTVQDFIGKWWKQTWYRIFGR